MESRERDTPSPTDEIRRAIRNVWIAVIAIAIGVAVLLVQAFGLPDALTQRVPNDVGAVLGQLQAIESRLDLLESKINRICAIVEGASPQPIDDPCIGQ